MSVNKCVLILPLFFAIGKQLVELLYWHSTRTPLVENERPSTTSIQKVDDVQNFPAVLHPGLWNILWLHLC
jgi:hypothetical protein